MRRPVLLLLVTVLSAALGGAVPAWAAGDIGTYSGIRIEPLDDTVLTLNGLLYGGALEVVAGDRGLVVIDDVAFEEYLYGLDEVPLDWPTEALEAQAIAARTYALWTLASGRRGTADTYGFDICATTACQVFSGLEDVRTEVDGPRWQAAVDATASVAVTHDGQPILARYHSTSGGRTRNNEDVFPGDGFAEGPFPYLVAVDSPWEEGSALLEWQASFPLVDLSRILAASGEVSVPLPLTDVAFIDHPDGDGPDDVVLTGGPDATDTVVVRAATFRRVVSEQAPEMFPDRYPQRRNDGRPLPAAIPSSRFAVRIENGVAYFDGRGWGHGVGMSQFGAHGLALTGATAEEILTTYYPGTVIGPVETPERIRVGVRVGVDEVAIAGTGAFRVLDAAGNVLIPRALGTFAVRSDGDAVVVAAPEGYDAPLTLTGVEPDAPTVELGGLLGIRGVVSKPAEVWLQASQAGTVIAESAPYVLEPGVFLLPMLAPETLGTYDVVVYAQAPDPAGGADVLFAAPAVQVKVVEPPPPPTEAPAPEREAAPGGSSGDAIPFLAVVAGAALILLGVAAFVVQRRRAAKRVREDAWPFPDEDTPVPQPAAPDRRG